ncbi:putative caffeine resistance protein 5 [Lactarius hatsudake]|nr:putative caffeine resistance protein 5 [Lactarius hatsudake]
MSVTVKASHDTFFPHTLRLAFGSQFFPHSDERELPVIWQTKRATQTSPRDSGQLTLNDVPNPDDRSITSEATMIANIPAKADPEKGQDALLVDWYGLTDPDSWPSWKKAWVMFQTAYKAGPQLPTERDLGVQTCLLTFAVYLDSAIYTAGLPGVTSEFHVSNVAALVGLTVFVAGYGLGPMVWAPLSESPQIGRMPIYIFTLAMFVVLQVPAALATNYGATTADIYSPKKRAYAMTIWGLFATCAPSLGPLEILWLSGPTLVLLFFFFPETSASNIPYRRAQRLRKVTGNPSIKSASEIAAATMTPRDVAVDILVRPIALNFQEPIVLILNVYIGLIYALLYIWFESFPIVFMLGLSFLGIFVGVFIMIPPFFAYLYFVQESKYNEKGELKPEERMPSRYLFGMAALLLFNAVLNYLADAYPSYATSVLAGNDFIRSMFGAAFPLFAGAMYRNLGDGWASTLLALLACAFIPIPILLYKYGEKVRMASRRAPHDYD